MSLLWAASASVLCAASMVLCVLYIMRTLGVAFLNRRWTWYRTEEMIIGCSAFLMFTFIIWCILDMK